LATRLEGAPTLGETVSGLAADVQDLVRGEIRLARAELDQKLHHLIGAAIGLTGGALVGFAGLVVLLEGVAAALALVMPAWTALLIVGVIIGLVGAALVRSGLALISLKNLSPDRTAANLQKDAHLIKEHT
jgi:uncharacterized membrane protein YqjE